MDFEFYVNKKAANIHFFFVESVFPFTKKIPYKPNSL